MMRGGRQATVEGDLPFCINAEACQCMQIDSEIYSRFDSIIEMI